MRAGTVLERLKAMIVARMSVTAAEPVAAAAPTAPPLRNEGFIDVRELLGRISIDELNRKAEEYFNKLPSSEYLLAKPFASIEEAPELLMTFGQVLLGLDLAPAMTVVDFGAGTCWASRCLSQLGMKVIAVDASVSALRIGEELYRRNPLFGERPQPRFLPFDGRTIALPDGSVDRILCFDAFHHVPNPDRVLSEMARILVPGGIAGFSEPGPTHSQHAQSQYEMRTHGVLENDVHAGEIWKAARKGGFDRIRLALFNAAPCHVSLEEFDDFLGAGPRTGQVDVRLRQTQMGYFSSHRLFFLQKAGDVPADSRRRQGLSARLAFSARERTSGAAENLVVQGTVTNTGNALWLPSSASIGAVNLGVHLLDGGGQVLNQDHHRHHLTADPGRAIRPGEEIAVESQVPLPRAPGRYVLEFDLVSEGIAWFAQCGASSPIRIDVDIAAPTPTSRP